MKKQSYLKSTKEFINYLSSIICGEQKINHQLLNGALSFETLEDAYKKYLFPLKSTQENSLRDPKKLQDLLKKNGIQTNERKLESLRKNIKSAQANGDEEALFEAIKSVLFWGATGSITLDENTKRRGTYLANKDWLDNTIVNSTEHSLLTFLVNMQSLLSGSELDTSTFNNLSRMNAGFTKIYALAFENFIIYDGRVGAALGYFVANYCEEKTLTSVPELLRFAWGKSESQARNRDPSRPTLGLVFPALSNTKEDHWAVCNVYANWIIDAALTHAGGVFGGKKGPEAIRAIEAALFMVGYELPFQETKTLKSFNPIQSSPITKENTEKSSSDDSRKKITNSDKVINAANLLATKGKHKFSPKDIFDLISHTNESIKIERVREILLKDSVDTADYYGSGKEYYEQVSKGIYRMIACTDNS